MRKSDVERYLRRHSATGLSRPAKAVYRVLLVCAKSDTGTLRFDRIGDKRFQDETGYGRTSVKAARKELVDAGLLEVLEVGLGRVRSLYRVVLEATAIERELVEAQLAQYAVAAGAEDLTPSTFSDPLRVNPRPSEGQNLTHPTRAHPSLSGFSRPYPPGQGPATGDDAALRATEEHSPVAFGVGATRCPVAASRGKPCASCRDCGTNPRARRKRALAERQHARVAELFPDPLPLEVRGDRTERGLALARAALAAAAQSPSAGRSAPADDGERAEPDDPPRPSAGAP